MTQAVCNFWIESLIQECVHKKVDFIVEGTMRKKEVPLKTTQIVSQEGYNSNLVIISTPYELSLASLEKRYSELKRLGQPARFTKKESHDEAYRNIEDTVIELVATNIFKKYFVYRRAFGKFEESIFNAEQKNEVIDNFKEGRLRIVEDKEKDMPFISENSFGTSMK
jgi:hypothetical protein